MTSHYTGSGRLVHFSYRSFLVPESRTLDLNFDIFTSCFSILHKVTLNHPVTPTRWLPSGIREEELRFSNSLTEFDISASKKPLVDHTRMLNQYDSCEWRNRDLVSNGKSSPIMYDL